MTDDADEPDLITKSRLRNGRGWTPALIRDFLGEPDATKVNPHYRSAPKMKLFEVPRVEEIEGTEEWQEAKAEADRRSEAAKKAARTRRRNLLAEVEELEIKVTEMPLRAARKKAIKHYNSGRPGDWGVTIYPDEPASTDSDPEFLDRITVNFIRHQLTHYDNILNGVKGSPGVRKAKKLIRRRVYREIAETYPGLVEECERQAETRGVSMDEEATTVTS